MKKYFNLVANIICLAVIAVLLFGFISNLVYLCTKLSYHTQYVQSTSYPSQEHIQAITTIKTSIFICVILLLYLVCCFSFTCCALKFNSNGFKITVCALVGVLGIFFVICYFDKIVYLSSMYNTANVSISALTYIFNLSNEPILIFSLICFIAFGFDLLSILDNKNNHFPRKVQSQTIDKKIEELKHLKELCVITQEQYEQAISNIIKSA